MSHRTFHYILEKVFVHERKKKFHTSLIGVERKRRDGDGVVRMGLGSPLIGGVSLAGRGELAARHRESGHSRLAAAASG